MKTCVLETPVRNAPKPALLLALALIGCSGSSGSDGGAPIGAGSSDDPGGAGGSGAGSGGALPSSGGAPSNGGAAPSIGGAPGTAGTPSTGGGASTGGAESSGGMGGSVSQVSTGGTAGAGGAPASCSSATLAPGETTRTTEVGGLTRTYILHVPASYTGETPVPLVLDFHGLFGSGALERGSSGYLALSDQEGFIVAYPDGIDNAWNVGPCCTTSRAVDDVAFARAIVSEVSAEGCVDSKRVYATGFSMGGGMSYHLACNAADVFAAVAPSAFDLLIEAEQPCNPSRPISVISFRGTADFIVPYSGGASNPPNGLPVTIHFMGAQATFERWQELNACTSAPVATGGCETVSPCADGVEVTLCTALGGGHVTGDARIGWEALKRHTLP